MMKKITQNKKEEIKKDVLYRSGQTPKFSSLGIKASGNNLKLINNSQLEYVHLKIGNNLKYRGENKKSSTFTALEIDSSILCHKADKPPLIPHSNFEKEESKDYVFEQKLNPTPQLEEEENIIDSQFLSSYSSMNEISDIEEHSGLKRLEQHLGNLDHMGQNSIDNEKIQLVTEVSQHKDDEVIDSNSMPIQATNASIRSKMMEEYKAK